MNGITPNPAPQSAAGLRSFFLNRWHFSSRLVVVLTILLLVGANLPGNVARHINEVMGTGDFELVPQYEHGWPLTHLVRQEKWFVGGFFEPTITKCWQFWDLAERDEFHPWRLLGNIAIGLTITIVVGCLFEIWRRRHRSFLQIHLIDISLATTVLAAILGWYVAARTVHRREEALVAINADARTDNGWMRSDMVSAEWEERGPTWLRLWLGDRYFQFLDRVVAAEGYGDEGRQKLLSFHELRKTTLAYRDLSELAQLRQIPQIEELDLALRVRIEPGSGREIRLPYMRNLRILTIRSIENKATGLDQMQELRVLRLHDSFISTETLREIGRLKNLRHLSLDYSYFAPQELAHLRMLQFLEVLELDNTTLREDELHWLPHAPSLKVLSLQKSNSSRGALDNIARCQSLETLYLDDLTESGLQILTSSPRLKYIGVAYPVGRSISWCKNAGGWRTHAVSDGNTWTFQRETPGSE